MIASGGSLGLAFGLTGAAGFLAGHGHTLGDLSRDPAGATRRYLETTSPRKGCS